MVVSISSITGLIRLLSYDPRMYKILQIAYLSEIFIWTIPLLMIQAVNRYSFGLQVSNLGDESIYVFSLITSSMLIVSIVLEML